MVAGPQAPKGADFGELNWELVIGQTGPVGESYALDEDEIVLCERCRQQLAVAAFRDRTMTPFTTSLLCEECLRAETGREFARAMGMNDKMTDEESRQFLENMMESMHEDRLEDLTGNGDSNKE